MSLGMEVGLKGLRSVQLEACQAYRGASRVTEGFADMNRRVLSLQEVCTITLLRHHTLVEDVSNVPYRLIRRLLFKVKVDQLVKLEESNPFMVFEDDEIWFELIRRDFDSGFQRQYTNKKNEILQYYKSVISDNVSSGRSCKYNNIDTETLKNFVRPALVKNESGLYQVPCRLLYERLREETLEKDKRIAAKVRETTQRIQDEKNKIQITSMAEPALNVPYRAKSKSTDMKSRVFVESLRDSRKRHRHFATTAVNTQKRVVERVAFGGQAGASNSVVVSAHSSIKDPTRSVESTKPASGTEKDAAALIQTEKDSQENGYREKSIPAKRPVQEPSKRKKSRLFGSANIASSGNCKIYIHNP